MTGERGREERMRVRMMRMHYSFIYIYEIVKGHLINKYKNNQHKQK